MSDWIEINLPYNYYSTNEGAPIEPDLLVRGKEIFGSSPEEEKKLLLGDEKLLFMSPIGIAFEKAEEQATLEVLALNIDQYSDEGRLLIIENLKSLNDETVNKMLTYKEFYKKWNDWYNEQPEVLKWEAELKEYVAIKREEESKKSFCGLGLNVPGTLIEVDVNGELKQYLIGDINISRGVCDDCCEFDGDVVVKRYKVVWQREK